MDYSDLPGEVTARLQIQYDVLEMTQQLELLESLLSKEDTPPTPPPVRAPVLPDAGTGGHVLISLLLRPARARPALQAHGLSGC